jgi:hypothetical protein
MDATEARKLLSAEAAAHALTSEAPFYVSRVFTDGSAQSTDWADGDQARGDMDSATADDAVQLAVLVEHEPKKPGHVLTQKIGTVDVHPVDTVHVTHEKKISPAGAVAVAGTALLGLLSLHKRHRR